MCNASHVLFCQVNVTAVPTFVAVMKAGGGLAVSTQTVQGILTVTVMSVRTATVMVLVLHLSAGMS